jgi:hypothetical protein
MSGPGLYGFGAGGSCPQLATNGSPAVAGFAGLANSGNGGGGAYNGGPGSAQNGAAGGSGYCSIFWWQ